MRELPKCLFPLCGQAGRSRGVCAYHYETCRRAVRRKGATWAELEEKGLVRKRGTKQNGMHELEGLLGRTMIMEPAIRKPRVQKPKTAPKEDAAESKAIQKPKNPRVNMSEYLGNGRHRPFKVFTVPPTDRPLEPEEPEQPKYDRIKEESTDEDAL